MTEILIILIATVSAVLVLSRLGLGTVLGYLVAGAIIGPGALGLINDAESIRHIGEFGVVFLLFLIGIEIKPRRLWVMRRMVVGLGGAQVIVTAAVIYLCARYIIGWDARAALVAGGGLALSSTAFGLQTLAETNKLTSHWGRASFSVLLFQDLAVVPFLVLLPIIAHGAFDVSQSMGLAILESLAVLGAVLVVGRFAFTPLFHLVARSGSKEVFAATALLLVLGSAWLLDQVGLSMAMGAFLAGILLSNNEYRHQVEADVEPFRGLLLGLFFISVGMAVDVSRLANDWALVLFGTIGLLVVKTSLIYGLGRKSGLKRDGALHAGLLLAQAGEFGFVLFSVAVVQGVLDPALSEPLIAIVVLSMVATPLLGYFGARFAPQIAPAVDTPSLPEQPVSGPVIIAGFGRVGETVAYILDQLEMPWVAVDMDVDRVARGRAAGRATYFGDAGSPNVLEKVGLNGARMLVVTLDDAKQAERAIRVVRRLRPALPIVVRARDLSVAAKYQALGADHVVPETLESSLQLGASASVVLGVPDESLQEILENMRANDYASLKALTPDTEAQSAEE